jgi:CheY-like chemotaxis protein
MVFGMIQRHSADIEIDSVPGRGTTVRLIFTAAVAAPAVIRAEPAILPTRSLRLLIADDDPLIIESLCGVLTKEGHQIVCADGGQQAIEVITAAHTAGQKFDIVITDLGMPYVDGRKVAAAAKQVWSDIPVVLLTGWGQRLIADNEIPPFVDHVLSKPPKLRDLRALLARLASQQPVES